MELVLNQPKMCQDSYDVREKEREREREREKSLCRFFEVFEGIYNVSICFNCLSKTYNWK